MLMCSIDYDAFADKEIIGLLCRKRFSDPATEVSKSLQTVRIILIELILNTQICGRSQREH